jgi:hypothetical protein
VDRVINLSSSFSLSIKLIKVEIYQFYCHGAFWFSRSPPSSKTGESERFALEKSGEGRRKSRRKIHLISDDAAQHKNITSSFRAVAGADRNWSVDEEI